MGLDSCRFFLSTKPFQKPKVKIYCYHSVTYLINFRNTLDSHALTTIRYITLFPVVHATPVETPGLRCLLQSSWVPAIVDRLFQRLVGKVKPIQRELADIHPESASPARLGLRNGAGVVAPTLMSPTGRACGMKRNTTRRMECREYTFILYLDNILFGSCITYYES